MIITSEKIYDSARIFFRENLNLNDPRASFEIEPTQPIQPIEIPDENAKLNLRSIGEIGRGMIEAQIIFNNQTVKKTPISFNVLVKRPIVVAAKEIQRNSKIHNTQLKIEHRTIRNPIRKPITEIADAIGRISKMKIREGEIITSSHLQKEFIVSRKASILLIAQKGSLKIQAKGIALENGELGQMIRVINANSKKELIGEVIGEKLIRIEF